MPPPSKRRHVPPRWEQIASEIQRLRDASIQPNMSPPVPHPPAKLPRDVSALPRALLEADDLPLTGLSPEELLERLTIGKVTATSVTSAYLRRAALAQRLTNCLTELLWERALARAKELDDYFAAHGKPIGPLHGLPISVKEHIGMAGLRLTAGYVKWHDRIAEEDADVLKILYQAGAVFHCRTTVPQTMMHLETDSNLFGVTNNPYNVECTSGGSSGGEGALIALRGSCLGIGSDVGGSIRNPAANCGIYGLKPTAFRIPTDGWGYMMAGADVVDSVLGPMSTSLAGLDIFMKTILDSKPWLIEPALIPIPWRTVNLPSKLKIAVMWNDEVVQPHPPITRALTTVAAKMREAGIEVVDWRPHLHNEAWAIISSLYFTDGGAEDSSIIDATGEPWRPLSKWIIKENPCVKKLTTGKLNYWLEEREAYRKEYAKVWNETGTTAKDTVDAILCPVGPGVAPKHNTAKYWPYTSQWNLLDYPAVSFPVMRVDKNADVKVTRKPMTDLDEQNWELYDTDAFHGLPISLQLVCRRFEDEKLLAILDDIKKKVDLPLENFDV